MEEETQSNGEIKVEECEKEKGKRIRMEKEEGEVERGREMAKNRDKKVAKKKGERRG